VLDGEPLFFGSDAAVKGERRKEPTRYRLSWDKDSEDKSEVVSSIARDDVTAPLFFNCLCAAGQAQRQRQMQSRDNKSLER